MGADRAVSSETREQRKGHVARRLGAGGCGSVVGRMKIMRTPIGIATALLSLTIHAFGQTSTKDVVQVLKPATAPWSYSVAASANFVPNGRSFIQPTVTADQSWLHLEARYNYEALETGSAWLGYNIRMGDKLSLVVTPMLGGVFGDLTGVAPGYELTLSYWKLELYSEGEFVFDKGDSSESFFYTWSQLTVAPAKWCQLGLVIQRTRAYESDRDVQRGFLVGFACRNWNVTASVFNPDENHPVVVVALQFTF